MWLYLYLTLGGLITFFVSGKVIDKIHTLQIELNDYNTLLKCEACGKFHRKYQEELEMRISKNYNKYHTCPRCHGPAILYNEEIYKWMNTNAEFPKLNVSDLRKIKKALQNLDQLTYEDKTIEKFLYYHKLLPEKDMNK